MRRIALVGLLMLTALSACSKKKIQSVVTAELQPPPPQEPDPVRVESFDRRPIEPIAALNLPSWIESVTPKPETEIPLRGQISLQFRNPLVPLGSIDQPETIEALSYFRLLPPVRGKFRFANPNLVVFEPEEQFPPSSRLKVILFKGLGDMEGNRLKENVEWTIRVEPIRVSLGARSPVPRNPKLSVNTSAPVYRD